MKVVDKSILFFSRVSLLIFSLEALNISWVWGVFILEWEWNAKSQVFQNSVGWWLGLATWLSREFKPWANRITRLDFLSCSALAGVTVHFLCMLHSCALSGGLPAASPSRILNSNGKTLLISKYSGIWLFLSSLSFCSLPLDAITHNPTFPFTHLTYLSEQT